MTPDRAAALDPSYSMVTARGSPPGTPPPTPAPALHRQNAFILGSQDSEDGPVEMEVSPVAGDTSDAIENNGF